MIRVAVVGYGYWSPNLARSLVLMVDYTFVFSPSIQAIHEPDRLVLPAAGEGRAGG